MYSYDEWGNPIETITRNNTEEQNKIAEINPLRYRGYYYDTETDIIICNQGITILNGADSSAQMRSVT